MNDLTRWAIKHHVSLEALAELHDAVLGTDVTEAVVVSGIGKSEAWAQSQVRIAFSASGGRAWRNNVGALPREDGVPVRFGLANDSAAQNRVLKSGDLIGIKPRIVTQDMVGQLIGQFWSRECKEPGWRYTGTDREVAQLAWVNLILRMGGDAKFTTGEL